MKAAKQSLPCALCSRSLEQRSDKNGKPYFVCDECGTQYFIRGSLGKERLARLLRTPKLGGNQGESKVLVEELDRVQDYIETFDEDQLIMPNGGDSVETAVAFSDWSRGVIERVSAALLRRAEGR